MATIRAGKRTDGSISNTALIRLIREGAQVYQESQTFARKQAAQAWVCKREAELGQLGAIERYMVVMEKVRALGPNQASHPQNHQRIIFGPDQRPGLEQPDSS